MKNKNLVILVSAVIAAAGAGFYGGMRYQIAQRVVGRNFGQNVANNTQQRPGGLAGRPIRGEVLSIDKGTMSIKMADGSSKLVLFQDKTEFDKSVTSSPDEIKVGSQVSAFGTPNSDGSTTAQSVQIMPIK